MLEKIEKELTRQGKDPNDFSIKITEKGHTITPKWFYEQKQISKQQDKLIIEDVNVTAETIVYTAQDVMVLVDTVTQLMNRVIELEGKVNG